MAGRGASAANPFCINSEIRLGALVLPKPGGKCLQELSVYFNCILFQFAIERVII
jgi:hypothetical protein